jgi:hypothetical protein
MIPDAEAPASLFVYFKLKVSAANDALPALLAMQQGLRARHPGLMARLYARTDEARLPAELTWMETYEHPMGLSEAFMSDLAVAVRDLPVALMGPRHTEVFVEFRSPAGPAA